ncbi:MAG: hypothetical protein QOG68_1514 [Solirubrobacteraceae bacterium]|nr:hypothetical protein [Solirubrobacteraceae bacterium]
MAGSGGDLLRTAFDHAPIGMTIVDPEGRWLRVNRAYLDLVGCADVSDLPPRNAGPPVQGERAEQHRRFDGQTFEALVHTRAVRDDTGVVVHFISQLVDVTDRSRDRDELARRVLEQSEVARLGERALEPTDLRGLMRTACEVVARTLDVEFAGVLELAADGLSLVSRAGVGWPGSIDGVAFAVRDTSHAGYTLTADAPVVIEDFTTESRFDDVKIMETQGIRSGVSVRIPGAGGPLGLLGAHARSPRQFSPHQLSFLQSVANIIGAAMERAAAEQLLRHSALHDELTGLPNRTLLFDRLEHALTRRDRTPLAVMFIDLDDFKSVNDTLGHQVGDDLLRAIAPRLAESVRPQDTVSRFGGDEFVILCEDVEDLAGAVAVAGRVREAFTAPFDVAGMPRQMTASIGVVVNVDGETDPTELIRDADAAVYRAKDRGRGWIETHDAAAHDRLVSRVALEHELRTALGAEQLEPFFQPIVALDRGDWLAMESLARWRHPERGIVGPVEFIGIAEASGLIVALGEQILLRACREAAGWPAGNVGVNVSQRQIASGRFAVMVRDALADSGLPPERLTLELTETTLFDLSPAAERALRELTETGVHLVLDDFGTGYSSLSHLRRFQLTALKIDRSCVAGVDRPGADQVIVRAVRAMAAELEIRVVAEGVETEAQAEALREFGCPFAQGYLFGRPMPAAEIQPSSRSWWELRTA